MAVKCRTAAGGGVVVLVILLIGVQRLGEPSTWALAEAITELGPIAGWRCVQSGPYVYDPRRDAPDAGLLVEAPEAMVKAAVPEVTVERVEADLRGGDTVVWSRVGVDDQGESYRWDAGPGRRVYVLSPGRMQAVTLDSAQQRTTICQTHLGDWRIVAEHALG